MENDQGLHPFKEVDELIRKRRYALATKRGYLGLLKNIIIMAIFILIVFSKIFLITAASGTNMYPSILDGDIILGFRLDRTYAKEDVVVFKVEEKTLIGRVVAKSGDRVEITEDGTLYVNGTAQTGEIAFPTYPGEILTYPYVVPEGYLFILGDFRTKTYDSRNFGPVPEGDIQAKVVSILRRRGI